MEKETEKCRCCDRVIEENATGVYATPVGGYLCPQCGQIAVEADAEFAAWSAARSAAREE